MANRVRISTTVDADRLASAREAFGLPDSQLVDRALESLLREVDSHRERAAILAQPYDQDGDLVWGVDPGPSLPYDGEIPADLAALASDRRAQYRTD